MRVYPCLRLCLGPTQFPPHCTIPSCILSTLLSTKCRANRLLPRSTPVGIGTATTRFVSHAEAPYSTVHNPTQSRGFGWRIHCGVEVTESSTNKQHTLARLQQCLRNLALTQNISQTLATWTPTQMAPLSC
jgi:hypothetical protein